MFYLPIFVRAPAASFPHVPSGGVYTGRQSCSLLRLENICMFGIGSCFVLFCFELLGRPHCCLGYPGAVSGGVLVFLPCMMGYIYLGFCGCTAVSHVGALGITAVMHARESLFLLQLDIFIMCCCA